MLKKILLLVCPVLMLLLFSFFRLGDTYIIKMRLNKGDSFSHHDVMHMNMSTAGMKMKMKMDLGCIFNVVDADTGSSSLKMTYTHIHMSMDIDNPNVPNTDSILDAASASMIGKSITLKLNSSNQIIDVTGIDSLLNDRKMDAAARANMENLFSKDQLNNMFGLMFSMYPKDPVKIGDTWNASTNINMNGFNMNVSIKYTLNEVKNGIATISVDATINGKGNISKGGMDIGMDMSGTEKGAFSVNLSDGYLKEGAYTMAINGFMNAGGQMMPLNMTADYSLSDK